MAGGISRSPTPSTRRGHVITASTGRRQHQILQRAAHADVFFAQIRIERNDVSARLNVQLDRGIIYFEQPRLSVVGLAARIAARTNASGPSLADSRQFFQGSYAGPSPALKTP
jgi:hypothetical protein